MVRAGTDSPGDVVVHLTDPDGVRVRVCVSPIATLLATVFEALLERNRGAPPGWYAHVRERASVHARALAAIYDVPGRVFPEFVAPNPIGARATIEEELAALRATPPERVRTEIACQWPDEPPPAYRAMLDDARGGVGALADRLEAIWGAVLGAHRSTIEAILEREVLVLGAALAAEGPASLLARLHPRIGYDGNALRWHSDAVGRELELADGRLVLVPMVAGPDALMSTNRPHAGSVLAYAAPGAAALWEEADAQPSAALARLLGTTRTRIMLAVATPGTTADVAQHLDISAGLASHHLKALERLGLVSGARFGRRVYYRLSQRGRQLRDAFS